MKCNNDENHVHKNGLNDVSSKSSSHKDHEDDSFSVFHKNILHFIKMESGTNLVLSL